MSSDFLEVTCGVPQGSILGPILFLCYINDMAACLSCKVSLYADDSTLIASGRSGDELAAYLSDELKCCRDWMTDNKLSLHLGKTECMVFGSKRKIRSLRDFRIQCGDNIVERVESVKYLGFLLDEQLSGVVHARTSIKRISSRLAFLYRNGHMMNTEVRKTLCLALVQPYFDYCCSSWYTSVTAECKRKLDILQRKMIRFIFNLDFRSHIDSVHLKTLGWLSVLDRVRYFKLLHVFRVFSKTAPDYMMENFKRVDDVHKYGTRGSNTNFFVPKIGNTEVLKKSFFFSGISDWNSLPNDIKTMQNEKAFKSRLKAHMSASY